MQKISPSACEFELSNQRLLLENMMIGRMSVALGTNDPYSVAASQHEFLRGLKDLLAERPFLHPFSFSSAIYRNLLRVENASGGKILWMREIIAPFIHHFTYHLN